MQNSELDWVPEDSPSPDQEHSGGAGAVPFNPQQNTGTASQAQATKTQAPSGGHNGFQEQDPFDQLLHQLSSNVADGQMEVDGRAAVGAFVSTHEQPSDVHGNGRPVSPEFDAVSAMPNVTIEELEALLQSENEQGPPLEEDYEYEAFLKVISPNVPPPPPPRRAALPFLPKMKI